MKANFEIYPVATKVQSYDKDGYYVMKACGYIAKHLGNGHAIITDFNGCNYSTIGLTKVYEVEQLKN